MNILVLGGTRFFGVHLVDNLLKNGHQVTIANRGNRQDKFGTQVERVIVDHTNFENMKEVFKNKNFDVVYDDLAYCSNDIKYALKSIVCNRYIMVSSTAVYNLHMDTKEENYKPYDKELVWCDRQGFSYDEIKRLAECALVKQFTSQNSVAVRLPFVIGIDDYTNRVLFYVEHIVKEIPMFIDNIDNQMSFISSADAGKFLSFLAGNNYCGSINGSSNGTISLIEIINYVENKTNKKIIIDLNGDKAPYNGEKAYSINTDKAKDLGFEFSNLRGWIFNLIDYYIELNNK
ncbi:NAD-dependent epimerase/dehydratase family protein [Clostridium estertheticum]|uniref:Galactowaldenase n=1 Tax=Clostridium estertheticum TaxID=238834 RepID=A0AA47I4P8_9CLOT|nr:NAD-dependent epimerase/dehydratase family protein [Clostridium estertheticum]MBU3155018.1 NAD-dependent epimerase/dehydratase family protein [Clostridium estertheticum]WAG58838.1 NAD-dependent epimerase/dehydratase family protein [Clostridium estertheticum]